MDSSEIIKDYKAIYERFEIPINLREHMVRVASVSSLICDNWRGPRIKFEDVIATALIHDLGNIVKFDFGPKAAAINAGRTEDTEYLKQLQKRIIAEYGDDDHKATKKMAKELGVDDEIYRLLEEDDIRRNEEFAREAENFGVMILLYADQRTGPLGIVTIDQRFDDFTKRYTGRKFEGKVITEGDTESLRKPALMLEKALLAKTTLKPEDITDKSIEKYLKRYPVK